MNQIKWKQTQKQNLTWKFLNDKQTTEIIFGGGAGGGKSFLGCAWIIVMCGIYPGTRWLIGRSKLKTLKETTLKTFFEVCKNWGIKPDKDFIYNSQAGTIVWNNGSEILLKDLFCYPSDPDFDELGSLEITGGFIDEINQINFRAYEVVSSRIRYKLDEFNLIPKLLGSCNPSKGWVKTEFFDPNKKGTILAYRQFIQALVTDNPNISHHYIENLQKIKNKALKERLLNGNWDYDDDPSCLYDYEMIADLFSTNVANSDDKWITADAARKGGDKMPVAYWEGFQVKELHSLPYETKKDIKKSSLWIEGLRQRKGVRLSQVIVDEDGVGGGVVDNLGCTGFTNNASCIQPEDVKEDRSNVLNYANLKTQCAFELQMMMQNGEVGIDEDAVDPDTKELIIEEFGQIKQKNMDKDGKISLVEKDVIKQNIGRSPDYYDTIMMRMYGRLKPKEKEPNFRFV